MPRPSTNAPIAFPGSHSHSIGGREPGRHEIRSRATDDRELTQPEQPIWNSKGYQMNAIQTVELTVE